MKNKAGLISIGKISSGISLLALVYLVISSFALQDAGFFVAIVISAIASLVAAISIIALLIKDTERSPLIVLLLVVNIILLLIYSVVTIYIFFVVPVAVNEMMNS